MSRIEKGWGIDCIIIRSPTPGWMDDCAIISAPASHQDQVVLQPPATESSPVNLHALCGLAWRDRAALSFHSPEFEPFRSALIAGRSKDLPGADEAIALDQANDNAGRGWIRRF